MSATPRPAPAFVLPGRPSKVVPTVTAAAVGVVVLLSAVGLDIRWSDVAAIPGELLHYGELMFASPDWEKLPRALLETWRSISMAWLGALLCVVFSLPLGMLAARTVGPAWVRTPLRGVFAVIRAVPEVIIALILLTVTGLTPFTGALALGLAGIGTQGKWTYESIESVQEGASEAVRAAGGSTAEVARWALWPAAAPALISFALYRFEINIRISAVLGLVGAGGIGAMLSNYTNFREWSTVGMLLIVVIVATMLVDAISGAIRRRIMNGPGRRRLMRML
ncbi:phosphonate ABC transporter, permease protein PhnE [Microbacterium sp. LRZ72]|uniref:phosphonate ABC transporter, permease protein PhnE n=1 Tax=Microbacterium sp. LRZ72 TaxID=2942481 RepID=UPI0029A4ABC3|nr:phosphonate ABC transporter, permease protein PhnE [Microbacterium sp. LRZ72]MDX2376154.1 phosphonate ABC transporter, permease protein PhnE [Microbacterium sp. LRZ72]